MARLLAPLEQISQQHPEPVIQELASDLRATIATRGAYHSDSVTNAAQYYSHSGYVQTKNQVTSQNKGNPVKPCGTSVSQQSPKVPCTCCSVSAQSTASVPLHPQNTACLGTVCTSEEVREQAQRFQHTDGRNGTSFRPKPAASTHVSASTAPTPKKIFTEWLLEACDPDVPTRAMALRVLTQYVKEGTKEALQAREKLLIVSKNFERGKKYVIAREWMLGLKRLQVFRETHIVFKIKSSSKVFWLVVVALKMGWNFWQKVEELTSFIVLDGWIFTKGVGSRIQ